MCKRRLRKGASWRRREDLATDTAPALEPAAGVGAHGIDPAELESTLLVSGVDEGCATTAFEPHVASAVSHHRERPGTLIHTSRIDLEDGDVGGAL